MDKSEKGMTEKCIGTFEKTNNMQNKVNRIILQRKTTEKGKCEKELI